MRRLPLILATCFLAACATRAAPEPSPGAEVSPAVTDRGNRAADVDFLQGMIHHHAQALEMVALIPERTSNPTMRLLGERIAVSQRDEIATMRNWLLRHGEYAPAIDSSGRHLHDAQGGGHEAHGARMPAEGSMPGMLTAAQMARLAAATGSAFERLFLESMIAHHEGALAMVRELVGTAGSAQDPELFGLASEIDADQRSEIARMRAILAAMPPDRDDR